MVVGSRRFFRRGRFAENRLIMLARSLIFLALTFTAMGCKPPTDLGQACRLVKKNPDGGRAIIILESEIKSAANKDFISFGSTDCENLTCVRDSNFNPDSGVSDGGVVAVNDGGNAFAFGYCSNVCEQGSTCSAADPNDDNDARRRLNCRALLLDQETLSALCASGACIQGIKSPFFCARGSSPDSGT